VFAIVLGYYVVMFVQLSLTIKGYLLAYLLTYLIFGEYMDKSLVARFYGSLCRPYMKQTSGIFSRLIGQ